MFWQGRNEEAHYDLIKACDPLIPDIEVSCAGKATYTMDFEKYAAMPAFLQEKVITERAGKAKELS